MSEERILLTENASKRFGGLLAVDNVSIHLNKGEILGLIGPNGAGKTTLFNMISGTIPASSGKIIYKGKEIQRMPAYKICKLGIGRTYQIVQPFSNLTVLENAMTGALMRHPKVKDAKEVAEKVVKLVGLEHIKDKSGRELNLVQLKRMEVARALATEPDVLLLDEVMAGLNPSERDNFLRLLSEDLRATGISIIVIEHVMKAVMSVSNRIYVLNQGKLIAEGKPEEIANNELVIKSYFGEKRYA